MTLTLLLTTQWNKQHFHLLINDGFSIISLIFDSKIDVTIK